MSDDVVIVIPARYASMRLPGKPLLRDTGKYLIEHVYELAKRCRCTQSVIVATDDDRIAQAVTSFGGQVVMTREDHPSGTDRIAEVCQNLDAEIIINLQGDEPQFEPDQLDLLAELLQNDRAAGMATLATPLKNDADWQNPNIVKVVRSESGRALYFSRAGIPFVREGQPDFTIEPPPFLHHLGVYAYRREILMQLAKTPPHPIELLEKLEQLRALAHGIAIQVGVIPKAHKGVDTAEDYAEFVRAYQLHNPNA